MEFFYMLPIPKSVFDETEIFMVKYVKVQRETGNYEVSEETQAPEIYFRLQV